MKRECRRGNRKKRESHFSDSSAKYSWMYISCALYV